MTQTQFADSTMKMIQEKDKVMFGTRRTSNEKWEPSPYSVRAFTATPMAEEKAMYSNVGKSEEREEDTLICDDKSREGEVIQIGLRNLQAQNPIKRNYDIDAIIHNNQLDQNGIRNAQIQQTFGPISNNEYSNSPIQKLKMFTNFDQFSSINSETTGSFHMKPKNKFELIKKFTDHQEQVSIESISKNMKLPDNPEIVDLG